MAGCSLFLPPTKTARGELYESGDFRYDPYFAEVHRQQANASRWPEESSASREPLVTALALRSGASNARIVSALERKKDDASIAPVARRTATSEAARARRLSAALPKLEDLLKRGEDLREQARSERRNMGADKADEEKVARKEEVRREVSAAVGAVEAMLRDAQRGAKEAEELAAKLKSTVPAASDAAETKRDESPPESKAAEPAPKRRPARRAPSKPSAAPKPPPEPAPSRPSEVFVP